MVLQPVIGANDRYALAVTESDKRFRYSTEDRVTGALGKHVMARTIGKCDVEWGALPIRLVETPLHSGHTQCFSSPDMRKFVRLTSPSSWRICSLSGRKPVVIAPCICT